MNTDTHNGGRSERLIAYLRADQKLTEHVERIRSILGLRVVTYQEWLEERGSNKEIEESGTAVLLENLAAVVVDVPKDVAREFFGPENVLSNLRFDIPRMCGSEQGGGGEQADCFDETAEESWGRQAVHAPSATVTGNHIRVCLVDSGVDVDHPLFQSRPMTEWPEGAGLGDQLGHGTHCAGIICGPAKAFDGQAAFGIAPDIDLFVANVFGVFPDTTAERVFKAVEWAILNQCHIVSLSLQRQVTDDDPPDLAEDLEKLEGLAQRALAQGTVLIAATGNSSNRSAQTIRPATYPGRCQTVVAVGGVGRCLDVMNESNDGADVYAPGSLINSTMMGGGFGIMSGTSMAAACASGIAALHAEASQARGQTLVDLLMNPNNRVIQQPQGTPPVRLVRAPA